MLMALFYACVVNDVATIKPFVDAYPTSSSTKKSNKLGRDKQPVVSEAYYSSYTFLGKLCTPKLFKILLVYMGWSLVLLCMCVLAVQLWLASIVFSCWRYFKDKVQILITLLHCYYLLDLHGDH
jgi:hypothetical protein